MAREIELTLKYEDGEEVTIIAQANRTASPPIFPPVFFMTLFSYAEKKGSLRFGNYTIKSGTFQLLDGEDEDEKNVRNIETSDCSLVRNEDENTAYLKIFTQKPGTEIPHF